MHKVHISLKENKLHTRLVSFIYVLYFKQLVAKGDYDKWETVSSSKKFITLKNGFVKLKSGNVLLT